ncbi:winged helix-turn-helix transcriptional regulator [Haladaptatus sp. YSMS36]|uniref:winged helix-turn-helix transcriptional regulator n=1 Tax=Haladaptatus sp. YSMS36 TaxID=3033384 RepID=UPI0023E89F53|nr:winged helix-turn-helix transcriptional regulator [Haladaptatus sp. YSMS36]
MTRGTPQLDWERLLWETRGYLGLGEADPVSLNELRETAEVNGWSEREFREAHRNSEQLVNVGTLDEPRVVLDDTVSDTNDGEPNTENDTPGIDTEESASNRVNNGEIRKNVDLDTPPEIEPGVFPEDLKGVTQWLTWKATEDGRKVPRAPYEHLDWPDKFVSAQDPDVWRDFDTAADWSDKLSGYGLAFTIRNREDYPDEQFVLVDYDDARDPDTGEIHPIVHEHIERADSYTDVSTSGAGVHIFCQGELPDGVKAIGAELPDDERFPGAEIEVYDSGRYSAMTGDHIVGTPRTTRNCQSFIDELADEFATVAEGTPDQLLHEPEKSKEELADVETTTDIQDVFDAIQHTGPRDIRLRSTVTHERGDGTKSLDPSWAQSKSGTRLAQVGDGWVYRKGMHGLGALQVVALEERIITRVDEYPTGEDFWAAVDALRQRGAHVPEYEPEEGEPVSALPLARLMALDPSERKRAARKRGLDWPTTAEARDRLRNRIFQAMRHGEDVVIDAPTALGKTYTVATEPWLNHSDVTDASPVVHFSETREARDNAAASSRDVTGVTAATLKGRKERCPVARGDHDPADANDDEDPDVVITMDGTPASAWFDAVCDGRGVPFSTAHAYLAKRNDQGIEPPCCEGDAECPAKSQWNGVPRDDDSGETTIDVVHATHQFANVPSLVRNCNVVFDERPDFTLDISNDRIQRGVTAFLKAAGAPVRTWESFVQLAQHSGTGTDAAHERDATQEKLDYQPSREWYLENADAHTVAPALARAIWYALRDEPDANGRRSARVPHNPPRLDGSVHENSGWNRVWVTVVLDEDNRVRTIRAAPDLSLARCVICLDAHPSTPLWQRNTRPDITTEPLLDVDERRLWRRFERGLTVVQVGEATRPLASGEYFGEDGTRAVLEHLHREYDNQFRTVITALSVESPTRQLLREVGVEDAETMHYGEEKSRNDFGDEKVGLVNGSIDPGDDYVLDLLAECELDASPETVETDAGEVRRAHGRDFVGSDAETAREILASVRENHVAQAAGRYARNADDPANTATVFVRTDAIPGGFADLQVPGVEWVATDTQRQIIEELRQRTDATARDLAEATDASKRHVAKTLARLLDAGVIECHEGIGKYGANVYNTDDAQSGVVNLGAKETANADVWDSYTWAFVMRPVGGDSWEDSSGSMGPIATEDYMGRRESPG